MQEKDTNSSSSDSLITNPHLPRIYANWVTGGHSITDIFLLLYTNGHPSVVINIPPMVAKNLHSLLGNIIKGYEERMGEIKIPENAKI